MNCTSVWQQLALLVSRDITRFFHFSLEIEFNALHFINYTIPRLCSTYAVATLSTLTALPWCHQSSKSVKSYSKKICLTLICCMFMNRFSTGSLFCTENTFRSIRSILIPIFRVFGLGIVKSGVARFITLYQNAKLDLLCEQMFGFLPNL